MQFHYFPEKDVFVPEAVYGYEQRELEFFGKNTIPQIPNTPTGHNIIKCMALRTKSNLPHGFEGLNFNSLPPELPQDFWATDILGSCTCADKRILPYNPNSRTEYLEFCKLCGFYPPKPYQIQPIANMLAYNHYGLFLDLGLGKTYCSIKLMLYKLLRKNPSAVFLVICPVAVIATWKNEIKKFGMGKLKPVVCDSIFPVSNSKKVNGKKKDVFSRADMISAAMFVPGSVILTTYNTFQDNKYDSWAKILEQGEEFEEIFCDESIKIKSTDSETFVGINKVRAASKCRRVLSGFPIPQSPADFVGQYAFMSPLYLGYRSRGTFERENANDLIQINGATRAAGKTTWRNTNKLMQYLKITATYISVENSGEKLPPMIFKTIYVDLSEEQKEIYDNLEYSEVAYINEHMAHVKSNEDMAILLNNVLQRAKVFTRLTGGYVKRQSDGEIIPLRQNPKLETLKNLIKDDEIKKPYLIFTYFRHEVERIAAELGIPKIYGGTGSEGVSTIIEQLDNGEIEGIVINPESGGAGLNLQSAKTSIFYTNDYKLNPRVQALGRTHRLGQDVTTTCIDLVVPKTYDETILNRLAEKKSVGMEILKFPKVVFGGQG